eukprot:TRINITY_DN9506_c0_g1_i1.p1 TRINITY_DN9506_c0_g1~~TRINITY_DN9506_c0_g1_i1.p1  ORF type:complete len:180 (+),score=7.66 TRINITY_DN9506_c0_g1_i1:75-542(+)
MIIIAIAVILLLSEGAAAIACPTNETIVCTDVFGSLKHARDCHHATRPNVSWTDYCDNETPCSVTQCWCTSDIALCSSALVILPLITIIPCILFCFRRRRRRSRFSYSRILPHSELQSTPMRSHTEQSPARSDAVTPSEVPFVPSVQVSSEVQLS